MKKFLRCLDELENWLEMIAMLLMVVIVFIQVVFRYCFNNALAWPEEIARYLFCWGTYLAVAISMRGDNNLRITILLDALGPVWRKRLNLACCFVNICFFLLLVWLTWDMTMQVRELDEKMISMDVGAWLAWLPLPFCFALITIQAIRNFYGIATGQIGMKSGGEE